MNSLFRRFNKSDVFTLATCALLLSCLLSPFFNFMLNLFFGKPLLILFILYLISLVDTIVQWSYYGKAKVKVKLIIHTSFLLIYSLNFLKDSEYFKSEIILKAHMKDDLFLETLQFRENGKVELVVNGFMAFNEIEKSTYKISSDTIFIEDNLFGDHRNMKSFIIDREKNALFFTRDSTGEFSREKVWLNYFFIER